MAINSCRIIAKGLPFAMMLLLPGCFDRFKDPGIPCKSISLNSSFEFVRKDNNQSIFIRNSLDIYYSDNYVVYQFLRTAPSNNRDGKAYMIYNKTKNRGYFFDSIGASKPLKIPVDSFLNARAFKRFPFYDKDKDSLVESTEDKPNHTLFEKSIPRTKKDETYPDSGYYYFNNNLKNIDYSFSRELDSLSNLKLYKVRLIYNKIPKGNKGADIPRREFSFEISDNQCCQAEVARFIDRFKKNEAERSYDH